MAVLTPCLRHTSAAAMPASCPREMAMICSAENLDRFIVRPPMGPDSSHPWRRNRGSGQKRWTIEDAFETAKNELGFDHNESRSRHGWYRHVSLVVLAFAMLARVRHRANTASPPKASQRLPRTPSPAGRFRKSGASPPGSRSDASSPRASSPGRFDDARTKLQRDARTRSEECYCGAKLC